MQSRMHSKRRPNPTVLRIINARENRILLLKSLGVYTGGKDYFKDPKPRGRSNDPWVQHFARFQDYAAAEIRAQILTGGPIVFPTVSTPRHSAKSYIRKMHGEFLHGKFNESGKANKT